MAAKPNNLKQLQIEMLEQIKNYRADIAKDAKVRTRAQEIICQYLDKASEYLLVGAATNRTINAATNQFNIAQTRYSLAINQRWSWALSISFGMIVIIAASITTIVMLELVPNLKDMAVHTILLGSVIWGTLGAAIDGLREIYTRFARQEFDPNRIFWYIAHPFMGAGLGAIIFLFVFAGLLSVGQLQIIPTTTETGGFNPSVVFLLAIFAGFEEQTATIYIRDTVRLIFRREGTAPHEEG